MPSWYMIFNSLGQVTSLLAGSPVVRLPPFSLWTGVLKIMLNYRPNKQLGRHLNGLLD